MKKILLIALVFILLVVSGCEIAEIENQSSKKILNQATISRVVDGDTVELSSGEKIRLLHINTPEKKEFCYEESTERLSELVLNKTVLLERDMQSFDKYNRSLRYIYLNKDSGKSVNQILVEEGFAVVYILLPNTKYHSEFIGAEEFAIANKKGCLWQNQSESYGCIQVDKLVKCKEGDYVLLRNDCQDVDLDGWFLRNQGRSRYSFSRISKGNSTMKIEREGWKTTHDCIWDDFSDTLFLFDRWNRLVLRYHY